MPGTNFNTSFVAYKFHHPLNYPDLKPPPGIKHMLTNKLSHQKGFPYRLSKRV